MGFGNAQKLHCALVLLYILPNIAILSVIVQGN